MQVRGSSAIILAGDSSNIGVAGSSNEVYAASGNGIWLSNGWGNYINAGVNDCIYDYAVFSHINVYSVIGAFSVCSFAADPTGIIDIFNGVGGYLTAEAAFQALTSDGGAGRKLSLGAAGYIDFIGDTSLTASNFKIG